MKEKPGKMIWKMGDEIVQESSYYEKVSTHLINSLKPTCTQIILYEPKICVKLNYLVPTTILGGWDILPEILLLSKI